MTTPNLPAAVLWDMDGTLVDSEHYWMLGERALAAKYSGEWTSEDGMGLIGLNLPDATAVMKQKMRIHDLEVHEIIEWLAENVLENLRKQVHFRPGAVELLRDLKSHGVKTALVTMSLNRMAIEVVNSLDFDAFDVVIGGDDVMQGKPHPEPYLKAAELLGVAIEDCIAIEDSINGITSAESAGAIALGIPNLVDIPKADTRTVWSTLVGVNVEKLASLYLQKQDER